MGSRRGSRMSALALLLVLGACASPERTPREPASGASPSGRPSSPSVSEEQSQGRAGVGSEAPPYSATVRRIGTELEDRMRFSHRDGCPVPLRDLRYLRMRYVGFDGRARTGEMVVHADHAGDVTGVFGRLYAARWPIRRMRLVDAYRGDDDRSMAADNTSGYNCRTVAGTDRWSDHAFGAAIDLNPVQNPYVQGDAVAPPSGRRFATVDRTTGAATAPGVIRSGDVVLRAFARIGWAWGGDWSGAKDYQHFSASGG